MPTSVNMPAVLDWTEQLGSPLPQDTTGHDQRRADALPPSGRHDPATEQTYHCATPNGPAELTAVSLSTDTELLPLRPGCGEAVHGHRAVVRSRIAGAPDVYGVFTRSHDGRTWQPVTDALSAAQLARWTDFPRSPTASMSRRFDAWLDGICERAANQGGWAAGYMLGSEKYMTIPGSAWSTSLVRATRALAEADLAELRGHWSSCDGHQAVAVVRRVRRVWHAGVSGDGYVYEVVHP